MGNRKDTWCLVEKVFTVVSGQSDTESCEDEPMPTVEEQAVQSIIDQDMSYISPTSASPSPTKSPVKTYMIVNGKLIKNGHKSSKQVPHESKYTVIKTELPTPKKYNVVVKDGECSRTCAAVRYYSSKLDPVTLDSLVGEETKENDNPDDPEDQISVEDMDLKNIKSEPNNDEPDFSAQDYENMCSIEYSVQDRVEYYIQNNNEFVTQEDIILETPNQNCMVETELVFDSEYIEEVGANIELSTEEIPPICTETISCDICDEEFEDRKELMRHIQTMHIG